MMKIPWYKRASFWNLVVQSFQIGIGAFQGVSLTTEENISNYNIWLAFGQATLGIVSLWTRDTNRNDIIDIAEPQVDVVVSSNVPLDVKTEIKETPKE